MKRYSLHIAVPDNITQLEAMQAMCAAMEAFKTSHEHGQLHSFGIDHEIYEADPPAGFAISFNRYE